MALILHIETTTTQCSVGLAEAGKLLSLHEENQGYTHAEHVPVFTERCFRDANRTYLDLDAIAVSKGPGSYTGLRIGVSLAKGLCYSLQVPLLAVSTLEAMCMHPEVQALQGYRVPTIDARRMEVYSAVFDASGREVRGIEAEVLTENSFGTWEEQGDVHVFGTGAEKFKPLADQRERLHIVENVWPSAAWLVPFAVAAYEAGTFEELAYFEPYYLKDFLPGTPKKLL